MAYVDQFQHADDGVTHLNSIVPQIGTTNPLLAAKYTGFVSIAGITVYELAIKDIFTEFARKKHKTFGHFVDEHFNRINGRIKLQVIRDDYISRFGKKYKERFERKIQKRSHDYLLAHHRDIKSAYGNFITWRNQFAHAGQMNSTVTYNEAVQAYEDGKNIVHCLAESMVR